jgi:hypothetical protein
MHVLNSVHHRLMAEKVWLTLSRFYSDRYVNVKLATAKSGHYQMVAGFLNSVGLPLELSADNVMNDFNNQNERND